MPIEVPILKLTRLLLANSNNLILYENSLKNHINHKCACGGALGGVVYQEAMGTVIQIWGPIAKAPEIKAPIKAALLITDRLYQCCVALTWGVRPTADESWSSLLR